MVAANTEPGDTQLKTDKALLEHVNGMHFQTLK